MYGKEGIVNKGHADKDETERSASNMIIEQVDGACYAFDTADCATMFKRFIAVYGSSFADE
jgi:hypothetical protein